MRVLWMSNSPWSSTGYGNQTRLFTPRLKALGHDLAIHCTYGLMGSVLNWQGIVCYPQGYDPWGTDVAAPHALHFKADILLTLYDCWVYRNWQPPAPLRHVYWAPVDHEPMPAIIRDTLQRAWQVVMYSKFGVRMCHDAGVPCEYVPHGVDRQLFTPGDRTAAREQTRLPEDAYIVGMVAANKGTDPSRKAWPEHIKAFAQFHQKHPDAKLYAHTTAGAHGEMQGVNLPEVCASVGLRVRDPQAPDRPWDVMFPDQYVMVLGYPDPIMAQLYRAFDVLASVSMGEGFGIPIVEAQACACPVIVGDWTSMAELCFGGWKVDQADSYPYWTGLASNQFIPRIGAIVDALEEAYRHSGNERIRRKARAGTAGYGADYVTKTYWKPLLAKLEQRIAAQTSALAALAPVQTLADVPQSAPALAGVGA